MSKAHKRPPKKRTVVAKITVEPSVERIGRAPLSNPFSLFWHSLRLVAKHWRIFGGLLLVYMLLSFVLVKGLSISRDFSGSKDIFQQLYQGSGDTAKSGFALFGLLLSTANVTGSEAASIFQSILVVVMSLTIIWVLRRIFEDSGVSVKQAFYGAMHPMIPFLLVLAVIGLQLLPFAAVSTLYSTVTSSGLLTTVLDQAVWTSVLILSLLVSLYFISSSIFALYAVTLPGMEPRQALRSVRPLARKRRWAIILRLLLLPIMLVVCAALIMLPIIWVASLVAEPVFFALTSVGLVLMHAYLYSLYRELMA